MVLQPPISNELMLLRVGVLEIDDVYYLHHWTHPTVLHKWKNRTIYVHMISTPNDKTNIFWKFFFIWHAPWEQLHSKTFQNMLILAIARCGKLLQMVHKLNIRGFFAPKNPWIWFSCTFWCHLIYSYRFFGSHKNWRFYL